MFSYNLFNYITCSEIGNPKIVLDHCLVRLSLESATQNSREQGDTVVDPSGKVQKKYVWDAKKERALSKVSTR